MANTNEKLAALQKNMKYVNLGTSGLKVSRVILGCMSYGSPDWQGWVLPAETSYEHIKAAYDAGINAFDTANVYSNGESEKVLGEALKRHDIPRDEVVILTKLWGAVGPTVDSQLFLADDAEAGRLRMTNRRGLSRKHIFDSVQASLKRLQVDYIDVLQCHRFDPSVPVPEIMQALHDVVQKGWVRYIGMSSCRAWEFHVMQNYAINNKLTPFISMQNHYNLVYREEEREMNPSLEHFGVGSIPWSPLARGTLTRPLAATTVRKNADPWYGIYQGLESTPEINKRVEELSKKYNASMAQISLAWLLTKPVVSAPIVGTTSIDHLVDILGGIALELSAEDVKYLEEPYKPMNYLGHA